MPLSKAFRTFAATSVCAAVALGLCYQSLSTSAETASLDKDFIVLNQKAVQGLDKQASDSTDAQTLSDWQFTGRVRPIKCRFVN